MGEGVAPKFLSVRPNRFGPKKRLERSRSRSDVFLKVVKATGDFGGQRLDSKEYRLDPGAGRKKNSLSSFDSGMTTLLVGFDSAWTHSHTGAVVGVLYGTDGCCRDLGPPVIADYHEAEAVILTWQRIHSPKATIVLLDQPTIIPNATGQRPVENLVCSLVSLRYGGMQPANTGRVTMFGKDAPIWRFLARFGGPGDPLARVPNTCVLETYPVLAIIGLGWTIQCSRSTGRLPKYNPERKRTFSITDWQYVCGLAADFFRKRNLMAIVDWSDSAGQKSSPRKSDQDLLDSCLCLLVAVHLAEGNDCMMVGNLDTGYIVVPKSDGLCAELHTRCRKTGRDPSQWVSIIRMELKVQT
jgi:predicted RNase H-like nuclease